MKSKKIAVLVIAIFLGGFLVSYPLLKSKSLNSSEEKPVLTVLSYDSFVGLSGPGPEVAKLFERICHCRVQLFSAGDAGLLLERIERGAQKSFGDVVLGVDQLMISRLKAKVEWLPINLKSVDWQQPISDSVTEQFVPFDWAPLTFIYREGEIEPPQSVSDLLAKRFAKQIAVQDPRTSSVGMQMVYAFAKWFPSDLPSALRQFRLNIHSVSPSWSTAYGLFQRQQTKLAFSYVTSLAYHWKVERNFGFKAVSFPEGHPLQIEYVAIPKSCERCELGQQFVSFLLQAKIQKILMEKNFMYPVVRGVEKGTIFEDLPQLVTMNMISSRLSLEQAQELLSVWQSIW